MISAEAGCGVSRETSEDRRNAPTAAQCPPRPPILAVVQDLNQGILAPGAPLFETDRTPSLQGACAGLRFPNTDGTWRGGRAVQCTSLENWRAQAHAGSNPAPSASL